MAVRRKVITMKVKVSVPKDMTAQQARREVRTLINEQTTWSADQGDVKALAVGKVAA